MENVQWIGLVLAILGLGFEVGFKKLRAWWHRPAFKPSTTKRQVASMQAGRRQLPKPTLSPVAKALRQAKPRPHALPAAAAPQHKHKHKQAKSTTRSLLTVPAAIENVYTQKHALPSRAQLLLSQTAHVRQAMLVSEVVATPRALKPYQMLH